ncbi:hypothetical protein EK21DRAFT_79747, partial [Setomelanomma holmii]
LQAEAVYQRSVLFRLRGDVASSNRLLEDFLDHADMATHITEKKLDVVWSQIYSAGKILKGQGRFEYACEIYNKCLQTPNLRDSKKRLVLSHFVDTYVELHYLRRNSTHPPHAENLLDTASKMIKTEIERLRIRRNQFVAAERILREVSSIYETLAEPDIIDRLGHIRAYMALARISPLEEAESYWLNALSLGRKYYPLEEEVFTVAIIHLFLCITRLQLNDLDGGKAAFDYAARICLTSSPHYLIPGAGTYLFEEAQNRIESLAGWRLPRHE